MSHVMDTGVRVNRMLAGALGVDAGSASNAADPRMHLKCAPTDAALVVFGEELDSSEEENSIPYVILDGLFAFVFIFGFECRLVFLPLTCLDFIARARF